MPRRVQRRLNVSNGSARAYDTQRPAICANGDCPIALTMGSQPSSNLGLGAGAGGISAGPFTALRLLLEASGKQSRRVTIRLQNEVTSIPAGARLRVTLGARSTVQNVGNLVYLIPVADGSVAHVGRLTLTLPTLSKPVSP